MATGERTTNSLFESIVVWGISFGRPLDSSVARGSLLETLLELRLVTYTDSANYRALFTNHVHRSTTTAVSSDLAIESTVGKLQTALRHD